MIKEQEGNRLRIFLDLIAKQTICGIKKREQEGDTLSFNINRQQKTPTIIRDTPSTQ